VSIEDPLELMKPGDGQIHYYKPAEQAVSQEALVTIKRLLDALHAHHNNDESPANCAACRKVLAP